MSDQMCSQAAPSGGVADEWSSPGLSLKELVQGACEVTGASAGAILLANPPPGLERVVTASRAGLDHTVHLKRDALERISHLAAPWVIENVASQHERSLFEADAGSEAGAPIEFGEGTCGALLVWAAEGAALKPHSLGSLALLARCAAVSLGNAALRTQVNRQKGELEVVLGIGREILSTLELEEVLQRVVRQGARLLNGRVCVLFLRERHLETLALRASHGLSGRASRPLCIPIGASLLGEVVRLGQPVAIDDLTSRPEHELHKLLCRESLRSLVAAPLRSKKDVIGVLAVYSTGPRKFAEEDLRMATLLATQSAIAIENARLYNEARSTHAALRQSEKLAALGRLSAGLAHEMRNPLNTLNVLVYAMTEKPTGDLHADLEVVKRELDRLRLLLDQFLDFARPRPPRFARERLEEIVEETLLLVKPEAAKRNIAIVREGPPRLPPAWADGMQIRQVLLNVLLNAMQALEREGTIRVLLREAPDALVVVVEDTGPGISAEVRERLFEPFFSTRKGGLGLGLSISQRILEVHSGVLEIDSQPGAGTRVSIKLPR